MKKMNDSNKHILFFGEEVTLAHIVRPLVLADSLPGDAYRVSFAAGSKYQALFRDRNFDHHEIKTISPDLFLSRLAKGDPLYSYQDLKNNLAEDMELISQLSPDIIVGDFRLSLGIAADFFKIPLINITNAHWSPYSTQQFPVPDLPVAKMLGPSTTKKFMKPLLPLIFRLHARPFNRLRRDYGLAPVGNMKNVYTYGTWTLLSDIPSVGPTKNLPANHRYIGPILWSPSLPQPSWWEDIPKNHPIIYVTLGSSGKICLIENILKALEKCPVSVALATAGRVKDTRLPANCFAADYLPALEILKESSLTICSGGSATAYQSLAREVPVLGFPSNADQFFTMESISALGAGELIRPENAEPEEIERTIRTILNSEGYKACTRRLAEEIERCNPEKLFVDFLNKLPL